MTEKILRPSGRQADALRPVEIITGFTRYAEGSVLIKVGHTHVLCNASVLDTVPGFLQGQNQGWVTAEYGMLPRATHTRGRREAARGKQSGRTQEIQRLIGRSLRAVFDLALLGERTIQIDCDVLQADGGTRCASITGAWVAAALAVQKLLDQGLLNKSPILDKVAAVSVGMYEQTPILDLDYLEDSQGGADMNIIMTGAGKFVEIQATAEGHNFDNQELAHCLQLAQQGIKTLTGYQQTALDAIS